MTVATTSRADPFLYDAEQLKTLASPAIVRRGLAYFKENRVTDLGWTDERAWAIVEGTRPGGYAVELYLDEEGELVVECDCPFDWEPACKHAIATHASPWEKPKPATRRAQPSRPTPSAAARRSRFGMWPATRGSGPGRPSRWLRR